MQVVGAYILATRWKSFPINVLTWETPAWMVPEDQRTILRVALIAVCTLFL